MAFKSNKYIGLKFKSLKCDCSFIVTDYYPIYLDGAGEIRTKLFGTNFVVKECCLYRYHSWKSGKPRTKSFESRRQIAFKLIEDSFNSKGNFRLEPISYARKIKV